MAGALGAPGEPLRGRCCCPGHSTNLLPTIVLEVPCLSCRRTRHWRDQIRRDLLLVAVSLVPATPAGCQLMTRAVTAAQNASSAAVISSMMGTMAG